MQIMTRDEIPLSEKWDLKSMFKDNEEWDKEYERLKTILANLEKYKGRVSSNSSILLIVLELENHLLSCLNKVKAYSHLSLDEDITNPIYQAMRSKAFQLNDEILGKTVFIRKEIQETGIEKIEEFVHSENKLEIYRYKLRGYFVYEKYTLDRKSEELLSSFNSIGDSFKQIYAVINNVELDFPELKDNEDKTILLTHGNFKKISEDYCRENREKSFDLMSSRYKKFEVTFGQTLNLTIKKNNLFSKLRGYDSAKHAALFSNDIPVIVYDKLIEMVNKNLSSLRNYMNIKKELLQIDELYLYDVNAPLLKTDKTNITYCEAKENIKNALSILGKDYIKKVNEAFENRWIDLHESKGKKGGAYSAVVYGAKPYILMNWKGKTSDMFTLAHELGHSIHSSFAHENQEFVNANYPVFSAEIAALSNEFLLYKEMIKKSKKNEEKLYFLSKMADTLYLNLFRQSMFAEFEEKLYKISSDGKELTGAFISQQYLDIMNKYYDKSVSLEEKNSIEWARVPHFYFDHYVYQYATGCIAACAIVNKISDNSNKFSNDYINFLKSGGSKSPIDLLQEIGVDISDAETIQMGFDLFDQTLKKMKELLKIL